MSVMTVTKDNYEAEVAKSELPVLLDLWAPWCRPCLAMAPVLEELATELADIKVGKIDLTQEKDFAALFGVQSIPMLVLLKAGKVVKTSIGVKRKAELKEWLAQ